MAILEGRGESAHRDAVIINTAALIYLAGKADNLREATSFVKDVLKSGKAATTLKKLIEVSNG